MLDFLLQIYFQPLCLNHSQFSITWYPSAATNKIALSSNDDNGLQTFDKIITYSYGRNALKVCESEMVSKM